MIDLGAIGNFIHPEVVTRAGYKIRKKETPYPLFVLDGSMIGDRKGMISHETYPL